MLDYVKKYFDGSLWNTIVLVASGVVVLGLGTLFFASNAAGWVLYLLMLSGILVIAFELFDPIKASTRPLGSLALCVGSTTAVLGLVGVVPTLFALLIVAVSAAVYFPSLVDTIKGFFNK